MLKRANVVNGHRSHIVIIIIGVHKRRCSLDLLSHKVTTGRLAREPDDVLVMHISLVLVKAALMSGCIRAPVNFAHEAGTVCGGY